MISTTTRHLAAAIASTGMLVGLAVMPAQAGTMQTDAHNFIHVEMGATTPEARSVGQFNLSYGDGTGIVRGSGVFVGGRYVLTSAHLMDDANGGFFTLNGQTYGTRRWVVANRFYARGLDDDPNPDQRIFGNGADLALVELDRRIVGARNLKATISTSRKEPGKTATIVGWGTAGNGIEGISTNITSDDGEFSNGDTGVWGFVPVKRAGKNIVEPVPPFSSGPFRNNRELIVDFDPAPSQLGALRDAGLNPPTFDPFTGEFTLDEDDIPLAQEYMPAVGDSGGGLFINGRLAGITSWSTRADSQFFSQAHFVRLSTGWWKWVRDNIQAFNHARANPSATPWLSVANGGNGFRGVARIQAEADDDDLGILEGDILRIFGPGLFFDETGARFDVDQNIGAGNFIENDIFGGAGDGLEPGALMDIRFPSSSAVPEPTSLALLSLGGLAMLRRARS